MKKIILTSLLAAVNIAGFSQIIADHTVVDKFDDIPQSYINEVKKMLLVVVGESHAWAYFDGLNLLEAAYPAYAFNHGSGGGPSSYTTQNLRGTKQFWGDLTHADTWLSDHGEEDWWTNNTAKSRIKAGITYCNETFGVTISALGFGWCYDAYRNNGSSGTDPVYGIHWFGNSIGSPDGDKAWGLDAADNLITGNSVNMDNYINATEEYIDYCSTNGYATKVFFTTGPVDDGQGESFYQGHLKYEYIRDYVKAHPGRILFDYADILCHDDNGTLNTETWNGHATPKITATNQSPIATGHISNAGAIRLAKAMWWMLARMAGWDGGITSVPKEETDKTLVAVDNSGEIKISTEKFINGRVNVYNATGSLVKSGFLQNTVNYIDTSAMSSGLYLVVLSKNNESASTKVILSR